MPPSPETLTRHELIGLQVGVTAADNPDLVGLAGRVVDETTNTLHVGNGRVRTVPKAGTTFAFDLPNGERVVVDGARLVARPARRTEIAGGSIWRSA